jgi:hypothetical protein
MTVISNEVKPTMIKCLVVCMFLFEWFLNKVMNIFSLITFQDV